MSGLSYLHAILHHAHMKFLTLAISILPIVSAFEWGFHQQAPPQQQVFDYQDKQLNANCDRYLCPETFACANSPIECPCPFPNSQTKCILPDKSNFVCIPKLTLEEIKGAEKGVEVRDCKWVEKAWKGQA
ncbi:unnamed protein product [Kuraishia capsulata CBS 1993]|uniref:Long chronological lifespan protein 2 n=1 Tax=Kuraishia capsulata CBS 1993 TaxID=1382522 RepID=W6MML4_9ASCO|nr:uncharacterized protein KUCA_T00003818001 [Kuraishia capsulata CBS 1993]CDK27839.1 unnamed protein product [Kuraishia capsulata CBS 1993]